MVTKCRGDLVTNDIATISSLCLLATLTAVDSSITCYVAQKSETKRRKR